MPAEPDQPVTSDDSVEDADDATTDSEETAPADPGHSLTDEHVEAKDLPVDVGPAEEGDIVELEPPLSSEIRQLRDTVAALEARLRTVSAAYKQQTDDVTATKERLARQASLKEELRRGEVVGTLFEPVENLRRSIEAIRKAGGDDTVAGLELVLHQFIESFNKLGLEEVPGKGSRFDPNLHEALTAMPVTDPALDGVVIEVFDTGYRIGSRLLKAARVVIGQYPEDAPSDTIGEA